MTPAFIRIVTEDILRKLIDFGYTDTFHSELYIPENTKEMGIATASNSMTYCIIPEWKYDSTSPRMTWNTSGRVDCGKDINKFLKLVSK